MDKDRSHSSTDQAQCVWVSAGVLHHHICDRDFDCDACPLHQALSPPTSCSGGHSTQWPNDRFYTGNHFWVEKTTHRSARIGMTSLATQLLHPVQRWRIVRPNAGTPSPRIKVVAELAHAEVELGLPVGLGEFQVNAWIDMDPIWPTADPWISGYLLDAEVTNWPAIQAEGKSLKDVAPVYSHHRALVHDALRLSRSSGDDPAPTADGGIPVTGLLATLGPVSYGRLVREVLRPLAPDR